MTLSFCKVCGAPYSQSSGKQRHKAVTGHDAGWKTLKVADPPSRISYQPGHEPKT